MQARPLRTEDLTQALLMDVHTRQQFGDVCSLTELPEKVIGQIYVVNTDPHWLPGKHWLTFYFPETGPPEFFDSTGHTPGYYHKEFENFLLRNSNHTYSYNNTQIQGYGSNTCGYFCLFYSFHRARGIPIASIINMFTNELWVNDIWVYEFVKENYTYFM